MGLKKVGVLFGGKSGEHDISILSASSILRAIDQSKYLPIPIAILKTGKLGTRDECKKLLADDLSELIREDFPYENIALGLSDYKSHFDVIFPILHGPNGEDGTIQGWLELLDIPYVGSGVLGSSTGMDKEIMKQIFKSHGLPQLPFYSFKKTHWEKDKDDIIKTIEAKLNYPCFVKPANMGSSVGITKVHNEEELLSGVLEALKYDRKIVVEKGIEAREIEVGLLGNDDVRVSVPGEIVPSKDFYDYEAKYMSNDSELIIPAALDQNTSDKIKEYAVKAFLALDCAGLSRVDFFIDKKDNNIYINEVNTMPGFTQISMYPKLWEASGISYPRLIDRLIELAIERFKGKPRN